MIDNFAIYHGSVILSGHNIWLPSPAYVRALQASGVIGSRPGWINAAVDVGKSLAGFLAGQVAGVFGSIWDTLTGLWDLATGVVETIRGALDGSLFASISDIYDAVTGLSLEDARQLMAEVVTMGQSAFADFAHKWNYPDTYQKWYFRGYLLGAVALEIVLAIFSGGASLAVKVLAKVGKYLPKLMRVLDRLLDVAKKLPGRRDRDGDGKRRDDDEEPSHADRSWEQALAMAALVTEEHDRLDTPVETLVPLLDATIAAKFSGVSGYRAIPSGKPHTYQIVQRARRRVVDEVYTEKATKVPRFEFFTTLIGKSAKQVKKRGADMNWKLNEGLRSGRGWYLTDDNGVERLRYRYDKAGKFFHEETGYVRWTNADGHFLDVNGKVVTAGGRPVHLDMSMREIRGLCADDAELDRVMGDSHISVLHLGGEW